MSYKTYTTYIFGYKVCLTPTGICHREPKSARSNGPISGFFIQISANFDGPFWHGC